MSLRQLIINFFPSLYIRKNFSEIKSVNFSNYREKEIEPEILLLPYLMKEKECFVDVGSNKGVYIYAASQFLAPQRILAFEPNPLLYKKLRAVFKNIRLFNEALSDKKGRAILTVPYTRRQPDDSLGSIHDTIVSENAFNFEVEVQRLDDRLANFADADIGLIKIDVEGNEMYVINGAEKIIARYSPSLIVEIEQRHHQNNIAKMITDLADRFDFRVYYFLPSENKVVDFSARPQIHQQMKDFGSVHYVNNFIFISSKKDPEAIVSKINSKIEGTLRT